MRRILNGLGLAALSMTWHVCAAATPSLSGTTLPSSTQIVDFYSNVWTLSGGQVYENGQLTPSGGVILVLCYGGYVYQENAQHNWWVRDTDHTPQTWVASSDPRVATTSGATLPAATQIVDSGHNVWTVSSGQAFENGKPTPSSSITRLLYAKDTVYQENVHQNWYEWRSGSWAAIPPLTLPSANGSSIPTVTQIVDANLNVWTVANGVVYENHVATQSSSVTLLLYYGGNIYQENVHHAWYLWNGRTWVATASDPRVGTPLVYVATCSSAPCDRYAPSSHSLTVIDTGTNRVTGTIPLSFEPGSMVVTPNGKQLYATSYGSGSSGSVTVIDTTQNKVVKTISPASTYYMLGLIASPDGTRIYAVAGDSPQAGTTVFTIDTASNTIAASLDLPLFDGSSLAISADGKKLYIPGSMANNPRAAAIYVIDTVANSVASHTVNSTYEYFANAFLSKDSTKLYSEGYDTALATHVIVVLNPATGSVEATIPEIITAAALSPDAQHLYGLGLGGIGVINTTTKLPTAGVTSVPDLTSYQVDLAITPDGQHLYITDYNANEVLVADTATYTISTILPRPIADSYAIAIVQPH